MNKQEIISILDGFPYSRDEYWIITGSAMVIYGIREQTHDIDMGCMSKMADQLEADGYPFSLTESGNRTFKIGENIEVFENWIKDTINVVDDVPVISIKGLVLMKQEIGRDKDKKDIALIKEYLGTKIELVENVLKPEDFVRLRATTGFADIPIEHAEVGHFWAKYPELYAKPYPISEEMLGHEVLKYTCLSNRHAKEEYGWSPEISLEEGIRRTVDFSVKAIERANNG